MHDSSERRDNIQVTFLGREPAKYEDFVYDLGLEWKKATSDKLQQ
jgi:hypothetical protein